MMKKNDEFVITIEDIGNDGEGIGHLPAENESDREIGHPLAKDGSDRGIGHPLAKDGSDKGIGHLPAENESDRGIAVFVKDAVVGDKVRVGLTKIKKTYAYGRVIELLEPSPYRVEARCANARRCGGCSLMHMSYEKQLEYKWNKVKNCLERIGGVSNAAALMEPVCGMETPFFYRNKMQFPVGVGKEGQVEIGFYAGRTHSIIDMDSCVIGHPVNDFIIRELRPLIQHEQNKTGKFVYNEQTHSGALRHILTRVGFTTGELMVCFVVNSGKLPCEEKAVIQALEKAVSGYNEAREAGTYRNEAGCKAEETGCRAENAGCKAVETGSKAENTGCREEKTGCGAEKAGCGAKDAGCREEKTSCGAEKAGCGAVEARVSLTSVSININRENTNRILGDTCKTIWGKATITDYIGDVQFAISPMSFYQVNPTQTKRLYDKAVAYAQLSGNEVVWDMYCGIGTISLSLAKYAKKVYGVEVVPQAIEDAKANAVKNGFDNVEFFCGKAEEVVPQFYDRMIAGETDEAGCHPDVVVVDPPRKGCDGMLLDTITQMAPKRLVYVSCDPATLARDIKILIAQGFTLEKVCVVDQFSHSNHVETVCLMTQNGPRGRG